MYVESIFWDNFLPVSLWTIVSSRASSEFSPLRALSYLLSNIDDRGNVFFLFKKHMRIPYKIEMY